ncbi:hypothetical protein PM082_010583 [Marasmius tenuissimus]|nr:hypothetical protein PM082_010583 [Marasmius tenuissimus]
MPKDNKKKKVPQKKPPRLYGRQRVGGMQSVWLGFCSKPQCLLSFEHSQVNEKGYPVHKDGSLYEPYEAVHAIQEGSITVYCFCCLPGKAWTVTAAGSSYAGMSFVGCKTNNCAFKLVLDEIHSWGSGKLKKFCYETGVSAPAALRPENTSTFGSRLACYAGLSTPNWMVSEGPSQPLVNTPLSPTSTRTTPSPQKGKGRKQEEGCDHKGKGKVKQEEDEGDTGEGEDKDDDEDEDGYVTFTTEDQSMIYYGPSSGLIDWIDNVEQTRDSPEREDSPAIQWEGEDVAIRNSLEDAQDRLQAGTSSAGAGPSSQPANGSTCELVASGSGSFSDPFCIDDEAEWELPTCVICGRLESDFHVCEL